jgi:anti-sigma regulatory factor (Ser/Thr protein kinase)
VLHGCGNEPSKTIHCRVEIDPSAFLITIRDPGSGFDPGMATESTEAGTNVSQHGRGICLMRSLMDDLTYRYGGTEVQLRKLRATRA